MIGASNVTTGKLTKFISLHQPVRVEHLLASCAVPNIFPAVQIDGDAYWDGLFSDNPPLEELVRARSVGVANVPQEIWVIKINSTTCKHAPELPDDIVDRRNQLEGNISLFQPPVTTMVRSRQGPLQSAR
jgi:NTE family protein